MSTDIDGLLSRLQAEFARRRESRDFAGALVVARQRSEAAARHYGTAHVQTAVALNDLAVAHLENRDAVSAEHTSRDAMAMIEAHAPGEAYTHAFCLATFGSTCEMQGRLKDAEHAFERSIERFAEAEALGSPPQMAVKRALVNVQIQQSSSASWVRPDQLRVRLPRETREQAEAPRWTGFGEDGAGEGSTTDKGAGAADPPPVTRPASTKGPRPDTPGDTEIALMLTQAELDRVERCVGPWHPDTLSVVARLALLKEGTGDLAGAEPLYRRALQGFERVFGLGHADTNQVAFNLATLLEDTGDASGAETLFRRVLEHGGPLADHPLILSTLHRLAGLLKEKSDYAGAETFYRRALEASERQHGNDHEDTLMLAGSLAIVLFQQRSYAAAQPLLCRAIEGYLRISASTRTMHESLCHLIACYRFVLQKAGHSEAQARAIVNEIARPFGMRLDG